MRENLDPVVVGIALIVFLILLVPTVLYLSLWPSMPPVVWIGMGLLMAVVITWIAKQFSEVSLRHSRYRYREETPLDAPVFMETRGEEDEPYAYHE